MTTIRAMVLAELERGPKTMKELLEAIDEIENEKQLANCLYSLRNTGAARRDDDGRYQLVVTATDSALATAMGIPAKRVARDLAGADAFARMPAPAVVSCRPDVADAASYFDEAIGGVIKTPEPKRQNANVHDFEEAERIRQRTHRTAAGTAKVAKPETIARAILEVRAILERAVEANQAALDDYLASVADPRILGPLRNARDEARAALAALDNFGGAV